MRVLVDGVNSYIWLEPALTCTAEVAVSTTLKWCTLFGALRMFVSDTADHFENRVVEYCEDTRQAQSRLLEYSQFCVDGWHS